MSRKQKEKGNPFIATSLFASAYLIAWAGFSIVAVGLQWGLERVGPIIPYVGYCKCSARRHAVVAAYVPS